MKYMLLVYLDENGLTEQEREECYVDSAKFARDLSASGKYLDAAPLHLTPTATSVRVREGKSHITDGPFAETKEQLGGYYLVEATDLEDAIEIASNVPIAKFGTIEVRPVMEIAGLPET